MKSGDRLIVCFNKQYKVGDTFKSWPLHITIVPWFRSNLKTIELTVLLSNKLKGFEPFTAVVNEDEYFGHRIVSLIKTPTKLSNIEKITRATIKQNSTWLVDETTKRKYDFNPHVTVQGSARVNKGDEIYIDKLYIIEQQGVFKEIVAEVQLNE